MHFTIDQEDATTVFRLKADDRSIAEERSSEDDSSFGARLDSQNAGQLKAEFLILAQADVETLIIDLTEVGYVDSAGLSALLLAERQMSAHGGDVRLVGLRDNVLSLLRLTQLDRVFPIFNTVDEALDAEPSFGDDDEDADERSFSDERSSDGSSLAPGAPSATQIKAGSVASGGSLGAAALARIMMSPYEENLDEMNLLAFGDEEDDFDDDDDELDDDLDDVDELEDDDLDDEEDVEEVETTESETTDEVLEDDDFEDDDFDDEELEDEDDDDDF